MRLTSVFIVLASTAFVSGQSNSNSAGSDDLLFSDYPPCLQEYCLEDLAAATGNCADTDFKCQCGKNGFAGVILQCIQSNCESTPDILAVANGFIQICQKFGSADPSATESIDAQVSSFVSDFIGQGTSTAAPTTSKKPGSASMTGSTTKVDSTTSDLNSSVMSSTSDLPVSTKSVPTSSAVISTSKASSTAETTLATETYNPTETVPANSTLPAPPSESTNAAIRDAVSGVGFLTAFVALVFAF